MIQHPIRIQKINFSLLSVIIILLVFLQCTEQSTSETTNKTNPTHASLVHFLETPQNIENKHYQDSFLINFQQYISNEELDKASDLLDAYGYSLDFNYQYDSLFVVKCEQFVRKHSANLTNYQKMVLNYYLASQYDFIGEIEKSDAYLEQTKIPAKTKKEVKTRALCGELIASHYKLKGDYQSTMKTSLKNIADYEYLHDTLNIATAYINLSSVYKNLKAYGETENCLKKSLQLSEKIKDTINIWTCYINLSRPNSLDIQPKKAMYYAKKAMALTAIWTGKTERNIGYTFSTYAQALLTAKQLDSVDYYIFQAEKYTANENLLRLDLLGMKAEKAKLMNQPLQEPSVYEKEYEAAKMINNIPRIEMFSSILSDNAKRNNDYKKAYTLVVEKYALRDSSWMIDTKNNLILLEKKFQLEKKERLIAEQELKISRTNSFIYLMVAVLFVVLLLWILFSVRKKRKKAEQDKQQQEQFTFQLLQNTEEERSRIANELHDSVNHELLTIKNAILHGKTPELEQVSSVIEEVRSISRNLHPAVLETIGLEASIEQLCERLTENGLFTTCEITYTAPLTKNEELQIYRIIQEALNNTLKHGKANAAKVNIEQNDTQLNLEIKDNGDGFDVANTLKSAKSFGLQSIMQRAKSISGNLLIRSSEKGTIIQFTKHNSI